MTARLSPTSVGSYEPSARIPLPEPEIGAGGVAPSRDIGAFPTPWERFAARSDAALFVERLAR